MGLIDLTGFGSALNALSFLYWAVAIFAFYLARSKPASDSSKKMWTIVVVLVFGFLSAMGLIHNIERNSEARKMNTPVAKAEAMFQERCKKSGEFIHRTAEDVDGIFLLKLRPKEINYGDQYKMDDPYGSDYGGDGYIENFFWGRNEKGALDNTIVAGYRYVDAIDTKDAKRYRYTGRIDQPWLRDKHYGEWVREFVLDKTPAPNPPPRYGVTYDDISTKEERDYWIAGSSLKVIDLQTNEVMAERIGYMMDRGQGANGGGRSPWLLAANNACPRFGPEKVGVSRSFHQPRQT